MRFHIERANLSSPGKANGIYYHIIGSSSHTGQPHFCSLYLTTQGIVVVIFSDILKIKALKVKKKLKKTIT